MSVEGLEEGPLERALADVGHGSVLAAALAQDQEGAIDSATFTTSLQEYLDEGNFRLVLVLDEVSAELERIVAYLDAITVHWLTVDLITLSIFEVNGAQIALPQLVSPDLSAMPPSASSSRTRSSGRRGELTDGADVFRDSVRDIEGDTRQLFDELMAWAEEIASLPNVRLFTFAGVGGKRITLLPRIMPDRAGLVTLWNVEKRPYISVWRSVFERHAPGSVKSVEQAIAPTEFGQGNTLHHITPEVLETLRGAYKEAAGQ